ncbi:MAG: molybdopterin molybdotransferase MoeA [Candidatus Omnitrophica bacterium]|nr:molybdopterin molybdotransferase MoeA [Candidatus Omnitrophota bacterium]
MLTHREAIKEISRHTFTLKPKLLPLSRCLHKVLAKTLYSPTPFPNFDNSAVDGYAIRFKKETKHSKRYLVPFAQDLKGTRYLLRGEIPAGEFFSGTLKPGYAMQIFTGAPVPRGTDAVIMQEQTERQNGSVNILKPPHFKENIRFQGEDFRKNSTLVKAGTRLEPAHLALAATAGCDKISVYPWPRVAILVTGNELLNPGQKILPGKIYDSNTVFLEALVKKAGAIPFVMPRAKDNLRKSITAIRKGLEYDVLIVAGGVSVGKYDFVKEALKKESVKEIFWKVNIKPGKPLYFGKKKKTLVFGLPGNPVSVFVTFEEFVKPALLKMSGQDFHPSWVLGRMKKEFKNGFRPHFVRVRCFRQKGDFWIEPLQGQGSHQVASLAKANALMKVEPGKRMEAGQTVKVKLISKEAWHRGLRL